MKIEPRPDRRAYIAGRMSPAEKKLVENAAAATSTTVSDFVRQVAVSAAREIVSRDVVGAEQGAAA
jgi:uncharacterized protein (DUF1778 family)